MLDHSQSLQALVANPSPDPIPVVVEFARDTATGHSESARPRLAQVRPAAADEASDLAIRLFSDEAEGYYLNVTTDEPAIFVHWREMTVEGPDAEKTGAQEEGSTVPRALLVTLSYNEAARLLDGGETVDSLPMPEELVAWLTEYVNLHYVPEQKLKRGRNRPSFMAAGEFGEMVENEQAGLLFPKGRRNPSGERAS